MNDECVGGCDGYRMIGVLIWRGGVGICGCGWRCWIDGGIQGGVVVARANIFKELSIHDNKFNNKLIEEEPNRDL